MSVLVEVMLVTNMQVVTIQMVHTLVTARRATPGMDLFAQVCFVQVLILGVYQILFTFGGVL